MKATLSFYTGPPPPRHPATATMKLTIQKEGDLLVARGSTYDLKEQLKLYGGRWNPELRAWTLPAHLDIKATAASLNAVLEAEKLKKKLLIAMSQTPEAKKAYVVEALAAGASWICCENCQVIDWKRQHTSCQAHAVDGNSFRVRGGLYTGD